MSHFVRNRGSSSTWTNTNKTHDEQKNLINEDSISSDENELDKEHPNQENIPWKSILLAILLSLIGTLMLVVFICSSLQLISFQPLSPISYLLLSFITLIPGSYHCFIAFRAFRGDEGYSLDDIAEFN